MKTSTIYQLFAALLTTGWAIGMYLIWIYA